MRARRFHDETAPILLTVLDAFFRDNLDRAFEPITKTEAIIHNGLLTRTVREIEATGIGKVLQDFENTACDRYAKRRLYEALNILTRKALTPIKRQKRKRR